MKTLFKDDCKMQGNKITEQCRKLDDDLAVLSCHGLVRNFPLAQFERDQ